MERLHLTLLGGFEARLTSGRAVTLPTRKTRALLGWLALASATDPPSRDRLASLLWGDTADAQARASLRQAIASIRRALGDTMEPVLVAHGHTIALNAAAIETDVALFEELASSDTLDALQRAVTLYRGDLLDGLDVPEAAFEAWLTPRRETLRGHAIDALARLLSFQTNKDPDDRTAETAMRLLTLDPAHEGAHRAMMQLHDRAGRRSAALRQYQRCLDALRRGRRAEPESATKRLYLDVLQRRDLAPPAAEPTAPREVRRVVHDTPLVGREPELGRLRRGMDDAEAGRGRVVVVLGEAGIGKTRLLDEVAAEAFRRGARVLIGHAYETEQVLPFGPWVEALRSGGVPADPDVIAALNPRWRVELARLFPELGAGDAETASLPENSLRLFESLVHLVGRMAVRQPIVLLLEDFHWADDASTRFLAFLARRIGALSVLVAVTATTDELGQAPTLMRAVEEFARDPRVATQSLAPLSRADTERLVRAVAPPATEADALGRLADRVWTASEGNPFVAVEMLREAQEHGADAKPGDGGVPERVRELIARRLDRLSERARRLVTVASVIGSAFEFSLLQRAAAMDERQAAEGLEELVRRRILHGVDDHFDFTHDRVRRAVHDGLLGPVRQALHGAVGRALESLHAEQLEEVVDRLAWHFGRTDDAERAVTYLVRFAERAIERYAHAEAVTALDEALGHTAHLPAEQRSRRRVEIVLTQVRSLSFLGRLPEVLARLMAESDAVVHVDDAALTGRYHFLLGNTYSLLGESEPAVAHAQRALAAVASGDEGTIGRAHFLLALEAFWSGPFTEGLAHADQALVLLSRPATRRWIGHVHWVRGVIYTLRGQFTTALAELAQAAALADAIGDVRLAASAAWTSGGVHALARETEQAIAACQRGVDLSPDPLNVSTAQAWLGYAYLAAGDRRRAIPLLERSVEQFARFRFRAHGWFTAWLAEAWLGERDVVRAGALAEQALDLARRARQWYGVGIAQRVLAACARATGATADATRLLDDALTTFRELDARFEVARTLLAAAEHAAEQSDDATAKRLREEAAGIFDALGLESPA